MRRSGSSARLGTAVAVAALVLAGCTSNGAGASSHPTGSHVFKGGTVYFANQAGGFPYWIFPFTSSTFFGYGTDAFQYLMYRPLYWFGQVKRPLPTFDPNLSLADAPTSPNGGRTVLVQLKNWKFSNGQRVDAQSVIFWMNMLMAEPGEWAGSSFGLFPSDVSSYSAPDGPRGDIVTITFDKPYSTEWLLYNDLSQITPMPEAWDITSLQGAPGSGKCGAVTAGEMNGSATTEACTRVWAFDTDDNGNSTNPHMAGDYNTLGTNPLWKVVDGPWQLASYNPSNIEATFVPNPDYSGPQRPNISRFVERWYPSAVGGNNYTDAATLAALDRSGPGALDVAEILPQDLPVYTGPAGGTGPNLPQLAGRFTLDIDYGWGINYALENFDSTGDGGVAGALFRQLYIRQALQLLVNQSQFIKTAGLGHGVPVYGPAPILPKSRFLSQQEEADPYSYNPARAVLLVRAHGWTIHPGGIDVCVKPGTAPDECGNGIPEDAKLSFSVLYPNNAGASTVQLVVAEGSAWAKAGIQVALQGETGSVVYSTVSTPCKGGCLWGLGFLGGWGYSPDYLPTGEALFSAGGSFNLGSYNDPTANRLITESLTSNGSGQFFAYENYLADQIPVLWQPNVNLVLPFEISKDLGGVSPINTLQTLTPESWYWKTPSRS